MHDSTSAGGTADLEILWMEMSQGQLQDPGMRLTPSQLAGQWIVGLEIP